MPGHCEAEFARLCADTRTNPCDLTPASRSSHCGIGGPTPITVASKPIQPDFELEPSLHAEDLASYDPERVTIPMQLTRGCVFGKCTYCTYPSVEPIADPQPDWTRSMHAIESLRSRTGVRRFSFKDSLFSLKNLRRLSNRIVDSGLEIQWSATTLLNDRLTRGLLGRMAESGCRTLEFGLETLDPAGQALFRKPMDAGMVERVIARALDHGIAVVLNQILGWPGQKLQSALHQLEWYERIRASAPDLVHGSFNLLEINRSSPMAAQPSQFGIELGGVAPWAFSYSWNAPIWRTTPCFVNAMRSVSTQRDLCQVD